MSGADDRVLILTTGGTIDKVYFDALSEYKIGESQLGRVFAMARVTLPFRIVELIRKDSLDLDDDDRTRIAAAVADAPESRIVITHGTDTMTVTAARIADLVMATGKTVVLVGALAPARFAESDAPFNLGMAFACAQVAPPGVWITMNGTVFAADRVRKDREQGAFLAT